MVINYEPYPPPRRRGGLWLVIIVLAIGALMAAVALVANHHPHGRAADPPDQSDPRLVINHNVRGTLADWIAAVCVPGTVEGESPYRRPPSPDQGNGGAFCVLRRTGIHGGIDRFSSADTMRAYEADCQPPEYFARVAMSDGDFVVFGADGTSGLAPLARFGIAIEGCRSSDTASP